jgi:hypothetical protein
MEWISYHPGVPQFFEQSTRLNGSTVMVVPPSVTEPGSPLFSVRPVPSKENPARSSGMGMSSAGKTTAGEVGVVAAAQVPLAGS